MRLPTPVVAGLVVLAASVARAATPAIVNDVSQLNPITVDRIVVPRTVDEVRELVRTHAGPISIGGARHSMGGQIAIEGSLHLDMRGLDHVVALAPEARRITVQAGITWRKIQEAIDPDGLAVKIMQSYANFTVGGSLSVNAHGRYVGQGPLINSVESIRVVLADGQLVNASRTENPDLFFGCIGGYGGLGVIVEATLDLVENTRIERDARTMPVTAYRGFFEREIRNAPKAVFHNGDLYPPRYDTVVAVTWSETDRPVTVVPRLMPLGGRYLAEHMGQLGVSEMPFGRELRQDFLDPLRLRGHPVEWRNYEASYDTGSIEPSSRTHSTYVLEEYFIPVARFDEFVPRLAGIFRQHHANVLNVSIRHAGADPGSLLAWAKEECFAFVVYYKQGVTPADQAEVGAWTRELIDAALDLGGSYYLPYQLHATPEQFHRAYPRADEFFALKRRVDPGDKFESKLWAKYYRPSLAPAEAPSAPGPPAAVPARDEGQTFLTLPEWDIVYSADEYAAFLAHGLPSGFPFFRAVGQFWSMYGAVARATWHRYPFNWGYHAMITVIGTSYSAEYVATGLYEATIGRATEWLANAGPPTAEDDFARRLAEEYARFIHATPWYEFPFGRWIGPLWALPAAPGASAVRRWERRVSLTGMLAAKAAWGWLLGKATGAAYAPEDLTIQARLRDLASVGGDPRVQVLGSDEQGTTVRLPRYGPFTEVVTEVARRGGAFVEIAGNRTILVTAIVPCGWVPRLEGADAIGDWPVLTEASRKRVALAVDVPRLSQVVTAVEAAQGRVEHVYDY